MSLRARLFATIVLAVLLSTVLTVVVAEMLLHNRAQQQALHALAGDAAVAAAIPLRAASTGSRPQADRRALLRASALGSVFYLRASGSLTSLRPLGAGKAAEVLAAIPLRPSASGRVEVAGRKLLYAARTGKLGRVVLVRPEALGEGDAPAFAVSLVVVGVLGALLAALLAWLLARRVTRPLLELARASGELPARQEPAPLAEPAGAPREVRALVVAFNEMARELVNARSAQRDFLLAASHELRSPISAIVGHAEGIEDDAVAPREAAAVILTEARRLERLVRDLLDLARLDRHEFDVVREPVSLSATAATLRERHAARARDLGVALELRGDGGEQELWVRADPERLLQAASNLLENALRVSPPGAAVEIELTAGRLTIADRGPGLSAQERSHAFERFYLHRRHRDARHGGAGLGLAIVGELMSAMDGKARAQARPGGGALFTLALELADAPAGESPSVSMRQ